ncbi:MAG: putative membrane protein [Arcticibacterium sp.]|jgi:uncharacterized membrane protein
MLNRISTLFGWLLLLLGLLYYFMNYNSLPDRVPTHFNLLGQAEDQGSKNTAWFFFGILAFVLVILSLVKKADPSVLNYPLTITKGNLSAIHKLSLELLSIIQIWIGGLAILVSRAFVSLALNDSQNGMRGFWLYFIILFAVIGLYIYRMRRQK